MLQVPPISGEFTVVFGRTTLRRFALCLSLLLLTGTAGSLASPSQAAVYGAETFMLANGMQVVVIPNHRAPVVSHMVWYRIGSADESPGKSGIAHFLEHLMFKGTPRYSGTALTETVAKNGGDQNAFTNHDYTGYYQNIAVDRLPLVMDIEADRMRNLTLTEEDVATEREVIIEERRMRTDNVPGAQLAERVGASLWMTNHYGVPVIGWEAEMRGLTREDAFSVYKAYYAPHNAILVVSGDITAEKLKPLAEKYYGAIPKSGVYKPRVRSTFLQPRADTRVVMHHERVRQPQWSRRIIAPSYNVGDRTDVHALELFSEIVGGGSTSKLYRTLVVEQQVAAGFSAGYSADTISYGTFYISLTPSPGMTVEQAEAAYTKAMDALLKDGITDADVAQAKQRMIARLAFAKDSPMSAAQAVGAALVVGATLDDIENWPDNISKITAEQVRSAARKLFTEYSTATGILLPPAEDAAGPRVAAANAPAAAPAAAPSFFASLMDKIRAFLASFGGPKP
jgi:zinc protease